MLKYRNLVDLQQESCEKFKDLPLYGTKGKNGYEWITYGEFAEKVDSFRAGLSYIGVKGGDRIAIISKNSWEWAVCAFASWSLNAVFVPMYEKQNLDECGLILKDSGTKVLIVASEEIYSRISRIVSNIPEVERVINIEAPEENELSFKYLMNYGKSHPAAAVYPDPYDLFSLIYTSGTTGVPKGVMLTHKNVLFNVHSAAANYDFRTGYRCLSVLPWAHI
ncbi:MAG: AMP-binding protein, partial [Oligoflexales bacterium]|nr:AMP-binding protein [Oligoflexales bacterium]